MLIVTIHHRPRWSQAEWVAVEWLLWVGPEGPGAQPVVHECATLDQARMHVNTPMRRRSPLPTDEPSQVETWM